MVAPFLLTAELLDKVKERIINVSSISLADTLEFDNLQQEQGYEREGHAGVLVCHNRQVWGHHLPAGACLSPLSPLRPLSAAYSASKLALNMWSYYLAHRMQKAGRHLPTVLAVDPGTVATKLLLAGWGEVRQGLPFPPVCTSFVPQELTRVLPLHNTDPG